MVGLKHKMGSVEPIMMRKEVSIIESLFKSDRKCIGDLTNEVVDDIA